jgi:hypothetical protein
MKVDFLMLASLPNKFFRIPWFQIEIEWVLSLANFWQLW